MPDTEDRWRAAAWNPVATTVFGYEHEQAGGRPSDELIIPVRDRDAHPAGMARIAPW